MARVQQYLVTVTVPDEDARFYEETGGDDWASDIQRSLDDLGTNVADEMYDDAGRMSVEFDVTRLP